MPPPTPRFLTLADVAEVLNVTVRQVYALVRSGDLRGIQIGGRGQWRVEADQLESYISGLYDRNAAKDEPFGGKDRAPTGGDVTTDR